MLCIECNKEINGRIHRKLYCYSCVERLKTTGQLPRLRFTNKTDLSTLSTTLTDLQQSILIGSLLGDGHLTKGQNQLTSNFRIRRQIKDLNYLQWTYDHFINFQSRKIDIGQTYLKVTNKNYEWGRFDTRALPIFGSERHRWYKPNEENKIIKIVPNDIRLDLISLAVWFADDGCLYRKTKGNSYSLSFATHGFTLNEVEFLRDLVNNTFNFKMLITPSHKKYMLSQYTNCIEIVDLIKNQLIEMSMVRKLKWHPNYQNIINAKSPSG